MLYRVEYKGKGLFQATNDFMNSLRCKPIARTRVLRAKADLSDMPSPMDRTGKIYLNCKFYFTPQGYNFWFEYIDIILRHSDCNLVEYNLTKNVRILYRDWTQVAIEEIK